MKAVNCKRREAIPAERPLTILRFTIPQRPTPNKTPYKATIGNGIVGLFTKKIKGNAQNKKRNAVNKNGSNVFSPNFMTEKFAPHIIATNNPNKKSDFFMIVSFVFMLCQGILVCSR